MAYNPAVETLPVFATPAHRIKALGRELLFLIKASRPGFWLTAVWFYLLPLWPNPPIHTFSFWLGLLYVCMPLGMLIYAMNDIDDQATDELNPRKDSYLFGARPTVEQILQLPYRVALVQVPFLVSFVFLLGPVALVWFMALWGASTFYNKAAKDRPVWDVVAQAGYLLVFVLADLLNHGGLSPWYIYVYGALFAMHSHLFGEVMDLEPDRLAGRQTTAVSIGVRRTKLLMVALLFTEALLAVHINTKPWLAPFLILSGVWFLLDVGLLWRERAYAAWQMTAFFLGWNLLLLAEIGLSALAAGGFLQRLGI
jgi:4-hydroxybenzoate polyprenyltransferase